MQEDKKTEDRNRQLMERFMMIGKLHHMYLERELNQSGVFRSQYQILMYIAKFPNASQKEIAERHHVSTSTIAVSLKKLEKGGYIRRKTDEVDNRFNQICLTEKGEEIVEDGFRIFKRMESMSFEGFSDEELNGFRNYLDRLRLNLERLIQERKE